MIGLDKLSEDQVEEGMATEFVRVLLLALYAKAAMYARAVIASGTAGDQGGRICALAGQTTAYHDVIKMIETAGKESPE